MLSLAIFGSNRVDSSMVDPGERVVSFAVFGGIEMDFSDPAPPIDITIIALFGGVNVKIHPRQAVRLSGFSLFGGRTVEPRRALAPPQATASAADDNDDFELPLEIDAYAIFGGVNVKRVSGSPVARTAEVTG